MWARDFETRANSLLLCQRSCQPFVYPCVVVGKHSNDLAWLETHGGLGHDHDLEVLGPLVSVFKRQLDGGDGGTDRQVNRQPRRRSLRERQEDRQTNTRSRRERHTQAYRVSAKAQASMVVEAKKAGAFGSIAAGVVWLAGWMNTLACLQLRCSSRRMLSPCVQQVLNRPSGNATVIPAARGK